MTFGMPMRTDRPTRISLIRPLFAQVCFAMGVGETATAVQQKLVHKFGDSACAAIIFVIFISASPIVRGRATVTR